MQSQQKTGSRTSFGWSVGTLKTEAAQAVSEQLKQL
jgi:hypothetical protein